MTSEYPALSTAPPNQSYLAFPHKVGLVKCSTLADDLVP